MARPRSDGWEAGAAPEASLERPAKRRFVDGGEPRATPALDESWKRTAPWHDQPSSGQQGQQPASNVFGGMSRDAYLQSRVHKRLQMQAMGLNDQSLFQLGQLSFNQQFLALQEKAAPATTDTFEGIGREGYMQLHVHRKLHAQAACLSDQELLDFGKLSFNDQFPVLERKIAAGAAAVQTEAVDFFGGAGRTGYMQMRVHRRLHSQVATLTDEQLHELGQMSFNQQFTVLETTSAASPVVAAPQSVAPASLFGGLDRQAYMETRVHRRLHGQVAAFSDQELSEFGRISFNDQFNIFEQRAALEAQEAAQQQLLQQQEEQQQLLQLQELQLQQQQLQQQHQQQLQAQAQAQAQATEAASLSDREGYMQQRVHRRLHSQATNLNDQELLELGQLSFNQQFMALGGPAAAEAATSAVPPPLVELFQTQGREAFMQQRVHRKLHPQAATLTDDQLLELGKLSFSYQFPVLEQLSPGSTGDKGQAVAAMAPPVRVVKAPVRAVQAPAVNLLAPKTEHFCGLGRESYMQQRVHRRLHAQAAQLNDEQLWELGQLSFNLQFTELEARASALPPAVQHDLFQGVGREAYMQQRVHRRLHAQAALLNDQQLLELGRLSFHDQFPVFEAVPS